MAKSKVTSKSFIKGGNGHMVGKQHSGTQTPQKFTASPRDSGKWAKGGSGKMAGKQTSQPAKHR